MNPGNMAARPWGPVEWMLSKMPNRSWSVFGCLSPEERCIGVLELICQKGLQRFSVVLRVAPDSQRYANEYAERIKLRLDRFQRIGYSEDNVHVLGLFASDQEIVQFTDDFSAACDKNVILDITCFPKRFFFPIIKRLVANPRIETLVVTYTIPERYPDIPLAEDHLPFAPLPLFGPAGFPPKKIERVIVSAGFVKLGLAELLEPFKSSVKINTILPFPPGLPAYHRNWEFIRDMEKTLPPPFDPPIRIEAYDCPDAFDHILQLSKKGNESTIFAPYGPKPISLAMCLFAIQAASVVYYTQPTVYHPDYSIGMKHWNGELAGYAYALRIDGRDVYSLS
jgi:hypothetical protein